MKKKIILLSLIGLLYGTIKAQCDSIEYFKIMYITTDSILVGDNWCHINDIIGDCDTVFWNKDLYDQALSARSLKQTSKIRKMAKKQVLASGRHNTSIRGLYGKGNHIEVVLKDESYSINHATDTSCYKYKVYFNKEYDGIVIYPQKDLIVLEWELLQKYSGITTISILKENKENNLRISSVGVYTVDIVH